MVIQLDKAEFVVLLQTLKFNTQATLVQQCISVADALLVRKGPIKLTLKVSALDGAIVLNITQASVLGISLFGSIRLVAGELIISTINSYTSLVKCSKNAQGNISMVVSGLSVKDASCVGDQVNLTVEVIHV